MNTIKIKVNDKIYNHLMWFFNRFSKDELEIVEVQNLDLLKQDVAIDLEESFKFPEKFVSLEELDVMLEGTLKKYGA
ncbi:tRNA pseudouridine synthase A [Arthrospiribacter ruber]|nr:tRNA pseudouridine synthase A [Arthrospiribacter ruber]